MKTTSLILATVAVAALAALTIPRSFAHGPGVGGSGGTGNFTMGQGSSMMGQSMMNQAMMNQAQEMMKQHSSIMNSQDPAKMGGTMKDGQIQNGYPGNMPNSQMRGTMPNRTTP